jgi:hypothetical protein
VQRNLNDKIERRRQLEEKRAAKRAKREARRKRSTDEGEQHE